jgi:hypothetical protein
MAKTAKISYTSATLAAELGTSAKALRVFLRSEASGVESVGKGGRYALEFTPGQLAKLAKAHANWSIAQESRRAQRDAQKAAAIEPDEAAAAELDEELAEDEPSEDELAELELDEDELEA